MKDLSREANLDQIAYEIGNYCATWGRICVHQTKEKYGTVRVYCSFSFINFHSLLFPKRIWKHTLYPQWLWKLDITLGSALLDPFYPLMYRWQRYIYRKAYRRALLKYPAIHAEIIRCADWPELLGGLDALSKTNR